MVDIADKADVVIAQVVDSRAAVVRAKLKKVGDNPRHCDECGIEIPKERQQLPFKVVHCVPCAELYETKSNHRR